MFCAQTQFFENIAFKDHCNVQNSNFVSIGSCSVANRRAANEVVLKE